MRFHGVRLAACANDGALEAFRQWLRDLARISVRQNAAMLDLMQRRIWRYIIRGHFGYSVGGAAEEWLLFSHRATRRPFFPACGGD